MCLFLILIIKPVPHGRRFDLCNSQTESTDDDLFYICWTQFHINPVEVFDASTKYYSWCLNICNVACFREVIFDTLSLIQLHVHLFV